MCLHRVPHALAGSPQHNGATRQVDSFDERRGANEESNLARTEKPLHLKSNERGHIAIMKRYAALDERCQLELRVHTLTS